MAYYASISMYKSLFVTQRFKKKIRTEFFLHNESLLVFITMCI